MILKTIFVISVFVNVNCLNEGLLGQSVIYGLSYLAKENTNSSLCENDLGLIYEAIEERQAWALKVLDASGHPDSGFFYGNNFWLGSYAQCEDLCNRKPFEINHDVNLSPNVTPYDFPPYQMGFYVAHINHNSTMQIHTQLPLEFTVQLGLCVPQSCSSKNLNNLIESYLNNKYLTLQQYYSLNLNLTMVRSVESVGLWFILMPKTIILIVIVTVILALTIIGTCYDVKNRKESKKNKNLCNGNNNNLGKLNVCEIELMQPLTEKENSSFFTEFIKCFSFYSNTKSLIKTDLPPNSIKIIHGLKFFGMLWVMMVHAVFYQSDYLNNVPVAYRLSEDIFAQILSNSTYSVDTYFFLSGFLLAYLFFVSKTNSRNQGNWVQKIMQFLAMFLNRFMRLTPTYIFVIIFADVMYSYGRKASVLYSSEPNDITCSKYWWRNLLYINNFYPRTEMCLSWSWYLSADTQFFAVASLILILSTTRFKTAAGITVSLIIGNIIATIYKSYSIGYIPSMDNQLKQLDAIYDLPWNRIGPYLVGVITAYIYVVKLERKLVLKERTRIILWILFPLLNLWILFTLYTRNLTVQFSAVYMGISRTLWGIGLSWLLIACCTGNARALEKFLSFPGWIPMSRLTYSAYLLNPLFATMIYQGSNSPFNGSKASFGLTTQGVAMTTYFLGFFMSVLIESPSILLTKMMFKKIMPKPKPNANAA